MTDADGIDYSSPFKVRIIRDCRDEVKSKLDGCYGTCLGLYNYPDISKKSEDGNPLIHADDGQYIWGYECWWAPEEVAKNVSLENLQEAVEIEKASIRLRHLNRN